MGRSVAFRSALVAAALAATFGLSSTRVEAAQRSGRAHVVYPGQTLAMIAKRYNVTVEELCKANGITKRTPIRPKQKLVIPSKTEDAVVPAAISKSRPDLIDDSGDGKQRSRGESGYAKRSKKRGFIAVDSYTGSWRGIAVKDGKVT